MNSDQSFQLQVAMQANAAEFTRTVQQSFAGECWDYLILTAANEKQAAGYRRELELRQRVIGPFGAFFPPIQKCLVVPDPPGRRAGSGGATLAAVRQLMREHELTGDDLERLHILLIHSGGASQRLPMYSPVGKIFSPLPLLRPDGQIATLFDHLYVTLSGLPRRLGPGMLVLAGDVFLLFDHRHVETPSASVTALSMRVAADMGTAHGVWKVDKNRRIQQTLQKASIDEMKKAGAVDDSGRVLIDTGLLMFDPPSLRKVAELSGVSMSAKKKRLTALDERYQGQIDLYDDMTAALARGTRREPYLADASKRTMRKRIWDALHGLGFSAMQLQGQFLHLGTTRQFRDAMVGHDPSPAAELFQQNLLAHSKWAMPSGCRIFHSALVESDGGGGSLGAGSLVEHSLLRGPCRIGAGSVVSQAVCIEKPFDLADNLLLFQAPLLDAPAKGNTKASGSAKPLYVHVLCGVEDDFKGKHPDGACVYLNRPMGEFLKRHKLKARDLWGDLPGDKQTLWNARLFPATTKRDALHTALWLSQEHAAGAATIKRWRKGKRYSMGEILEQADPQGLIEHRELVAAWLQTSDYLEAIRKGDDRPTEAHIGHYATASAYEASENMLRAFAGDGDRDAARAMEQARALWSVGQLLQRADHPEPASARQRIDEVCTEAFARVRSASEIGYQAIEVGESALPNLKPGVEIAATAPVRLDLTGGWTDTPPYCFERGGHVINVAIDLDNEPPIRVTIKTLKQPKLLIHSHDLGQTLDLAKEKKHGSTPLDVRDAFSLHRVALELTGILQRGKTPAESLKRLGVGLEISTASRVPKGSGLGTSSMLAAALLAALQKLLGRKYSTERLIEQTLVLEQRLSTGGGWQDQAGGIIGGVKSTTSRAGVPQRPLVQPLTLSDAQYQQLQDRLVIYFSGQQRLARDILRQVMGRWLAREPAMLDCMRRLHQSATRMEQAIVKSDWEDVGREIADYWQIKCDLYPGSTTPFIDVLFLECRDHYLAGALAGAGGGGFAYFFCRDLHQATLLRTRLQERASRPGSAGSLYETRINREGLKVVKRKARG